MGISLCFNYTTDFALFFAAASSACVYYEYSCGLPLNLILYGCETSPSPPAYIAETLRIIKYSLTAFLFYFLANRLRRRLRSLRSSCERPWLLILGSCKSASPPPAYITETVLITVYSHLVFSSYLLVNIVRRRLRLLRSSCESLCILALYSHFMFL